MTPKSTEQDRVSWVGRRREEEEEEEERYFRRAFFDVLKKEKENEEKNMNEKTRPDTQDAPCMRSFHPRK